MARNDRNLRGIYNTLRKNGYNPPEFEEFVSDMQDDNNLRGVHNTLRKHGYTPPEFDEFRSDMFGTDAGPASAPRYVHPEAGNRRPVSADDLVGLPRPVSADDVRETPPPAVTDDTRGTSSATVADDTRRVSQPAVAASRWQPTEQDRIRMSMNLDRMTGDFNQRSKSVVEQTRRVTEGMTPAGREKLKAAEFQARFAGTPTKVFGLTPDASVAPADGEPAEVPPSDAAKSGKFLSGQSPVPYGVKMVDGEPTTQWLLPDGRVTTSLIEADRAESGARRVRLMNRFADRMKANGLDPASQEDVAKQAQLDFEAPLREVLDSVWAQAEEDDRAADEEYRRAQAEYNDRAGSNVRAFDPGGMPLQVPEENMRDFNRAVRRRETFDLESMAEEILGRLPAAYRQKALQGYQQYFTSHTDELNGRSVSQAAEEALRSEVYNTVYQRAVDKRLPKDKAEFLIRKIADQPLLSPHQSMGIAASAISDSWGMNVADIDAMGRYGREHRALDIAGTVFNMTLDPITYISGGVGGAAGKQALKIGGKQVLKDAAGDVAGRYAARTLTGRVLAGAAGGAANFGTFEALKSVQGQMATGGVVNPETGEREFSFGEVLKATGHGLILGGVTGMLSPVIGNVADKYVKATTSTGGKMAIRSGELVTSTLAEGTIFSAYDIYENSQLADDDPNKRSNFDIWSDSMAMMLGFKGSHLVKSAPRHIAELRPIKPADGRQLTQAERNHNRKSFEERLRKSLDASPRDLDFTEEERDELRRAGYGELADLFSRDRVQEVRRHNINPAEGAIELRAERVEAETVHRSPESDGYSAMEELMQDGRVSQAARAKAYYILTGRMLPMGTVAGYTTQQTEDGSVIVNSVTADGEVVTSRRFADETKAQHEIDNINRQAELNTIDVGERFRDAEANGKVFMAAVNEVAPGTDPTAIRKIYEAVKRGDGNVTDSQRQLVELLDQAIARNAKVGAEMRSEAIRERLNRESGLDVDKVLRKSPQDRTAGEQTLVERYARELFPEQTRRQERREQTEAARMYQESRLLYGRFEQGDSTAQAEMDAIARRMQEAYDNFNEVFGSEAEYYMSGIDNPELTPDQRNEAQWALLDDPELTADQQDAVLYYINAKAALDGVLDASNEAADRKRVEVERSVQLRTHRKKGMIIPAETKTGKQVYIVSGDVVMFPDGKGVDRRNSSSQIFVFNPESGEYEPSAPEFIERVGEAVNPQEELDTALSEIEQERMSVFSENAVASEEPAEGAEPQQKPESVPNPVENAVSSQSEAAQPMTEGKIAPEAVANVENGQQTALSRIPLNEQGEPMFEAVDRDTAWDGLVEAVGGEADAADIAMAQVQQAGTDLEALRKKLPTLKTPKLKGSPMAMAQAKREAAEQYQRDLARYNQQVADTQTRLDAWNGIAGVYKSRNAELRRQQEEERRQRDAIARDEAVARFEEEQRIKAEKQAEQERIGVHAVHPKIRERWESAPKVEGAEDVLTLPDGSTIAGRYVLTESGAASPSHDANNAYMPTEGFPIDENGQSVNDRDYMRDKDAQLIVERMADAYDSRALQDPVVVSNDGVVLSGNNRTMSGDLAARQGTDDGYLDYLRRFGYRKYGFTPEQVQGMKHPRVVFVPDESMSYDATTFSRFNAQDKKSQGKPEAAVKLGKTVPDDVFDSIVNDISRYDRLSDYYGDEKAVAHALGILMQTGVINDKDMPGLRTGTALSASGKELIENILIGKVFQTMPDAVRQAISIPSLRQGIVTGLSEIASNRTLGRSGYSLSEELAKAVDLVYRARTAQPKVYTEGVPVSPYGRMAGLFDDEFGDSRVTDATVLLLADILNSGKPSDLRKMLATYNNEAAQASGGQIDIFSGSIPTKEEILTNVNEHFRNATPKEQQARVDAAIAERKRRAEAEAEQRGRGQESEQTPNGTERSAEAQQPAAVAEEELTPEEQALAARIEITDNDWTEGEGDTPTYKRDIIIDGTHKVTQVDAPDDNGHYTGSYFEFDGKGFGDIAEVARYIDGHTSAELKVDGGMKSEPTEAQKAAGNYKMEHRRVDGYNISIENTKGSVRRGTGADGKSWETTMQNDYGYIRGTEGVDGDHIDVFLSDTPEKGDVFVVDQVNEDGSFDEHKVMYGFPTEQAAREAYLSNYEPGWTGLGAITHVSKEEFKKWIQSSKRKTKPFAEYKSVKPKDDNSMVGRSLSEQEATDLIAQMEANAEIASAIELTPENWIAQFGEDGTVETPIGIVKMGENQYFKMARQGRNGKLGMVKPTLQTPDVVVADYRPASDGVSERDTSYIFVKTFTKEDGERYYYFTSVTVRKNGREVVISNQERSDKRISKLLQQGEVAWIKEDSLHPKAQVGKSVPLNDSSNPTNSDNEIARLGVNSSANDESLSPSSERQAEREDGQLLILPSETSEEAGALSGPTFDSPSDGKDNTLSADKQTDSVESSLQIKAAQPITEPYTITPTTYTNKKGKTSDVHLVRFNRELTKEEKAALDTFAREPLTEGKKTSRGWYDRKQGGYMMRSEEAARQLAGMVGNEEAVADAQPMTAEELREAVGASSTRNSRPKKAPVNRVSLEDVMTDLSTKGETRLSDHAEPVKEEPETQHEISDDEMQSLAKEIRDLLGIGEDEGDSNIRFRDPGELTPQERQRLQSAGIRMAMGLISRGTTSFPDYATKMVGLLGDKIRPWLKSFYEGARWTPGYEQYPFTPSEAVAVFDVQNFDKKQADPIAQAAMIVEERKASTASAQAQKELTEIRNKNRRENDKQREADTAALAAKESIFEQAERVAKEAQKKRLIKKEIPEEKGWTSKSTSILSTNGNGAKVEIPTDLAKKNLDKVGNDFSHIKNTKGFIAEVSKALGSPEGMAQQSFYYELVGDNGAVLTLRLSNHNVNAANYDGKTPEISVVIKSRRQPNRFYPSEQAEVTEYVYFKEDIANGDGNTLSMIAKDIADLLETGRYADTSGIAVVNHSPTTPDATAIVVDMSKGGTGKKPAKKKTVNPEQPVADLFSDLWSERQADDGDLFDEPINTTTDEKKTDVQPRPGVAKRERGLEPQPNEPLGESQRNEVKGTDGRGMGGRDSVNPMSDRERGTGVSRKPAYAARITETDIDGADVPQVVKDGAKRALSGSASMTDNFALSEVRKKIKRVAAASQSLRETERKNVRNNHVERGVDYAPKGEDARIKANIEAIELAKRLLDAGETATPEQMAVLRRFSGWGGLGKAFNEQGYTPNPTAKRLRELLGDQGYQDAVDSRRSAYYTPAEVIDTMWDVAKAMGFKGGNVLEGSAGIGNILGLMPVELSDRSSIHAVEIDSTTGGILSLLYPDAKVEIQGFEKTRVQNGSIDLAITNVPFIAGAKVFDETGDKDLSKKFHDIHDFCIAKNIRKLRDGGIGIFITSSGTMDNSKELRRWIINEGNADVVGAFRMHNKTFGGAGATSDIIVVRKRVNGKPSPNAIDVTDVTGVRVADYDTGDTRKVKGQEIPIIKPYSMIYNKYFAEHPENMAGEMRFGFEEGDTFRPKSKALYPVKGKDQSEMLTAWVNRIAAMAERRSGNADMEEEAATPKVEKEVIRINERLGEGVKEGSMVLNSQGELCMARMGEAVPLGLNRNKVKGHTKAECFNAYTAIKKALSDVLEYQSSYEDNEGLAPLLKELNRAFDTFTQTYGNLHKNTAISFLRNDVDYSSILALETYSEKGDKKGNKVVKVGKTDIFCRRVIETEKEPQPATIKDGILASLYKNGGVDVDYIGQALGKPAEEVKREIIESGLGFENPSTGAMEVSYRYLSGNVREKLYIAQENNVDGRYDANIKALESVMPMTIPAHLIEFALGSSWIEPKLYEDFVFEKTGIRVKLTNVGGTWFMKTPWSTYNEKNRSMAVVSRMCDKTIMGHELIESAITNKQITVSKTVRRNADTTETITDRSATAECGIKVDEIRAEFKDWAREHIQTDPEMSARIEQIYNERFNNYVPMTIPDDFVPQHFGGQVSELHGRPFALRPHQGRAVVRGTTEPILLAHEVGTGKTYTLITTAMEMRRLGTARKPMIVVQNATVGQFVESAKEIYPNAKVLTIEEADRTAEGRRNFYAKIKYNDWDMIVIPQSVFERIPDSPEREMAYVKEIIEEKMKVLAAMREADSGGRSMIVRQAERELAEQEERLVELTEAIQGRKKKRDEKREATTRQNAEVRALEMLDREVDDVENFDDMGIDAILVDEAHEYKHLGFSTAMQRGVKGVDPSYSKKSQGVFLKAQAVMERNNGRNVVFATGTPISNTAAEIWTFMRYLMPVDTMKAYGIYYFDDFVRNFGNIAQMVEFVNGKFKENNRFAGYVNLPELIRIWSGVADTVLTRDAGEVSDKIPKMESGKPQDIYLPQTRALRSVMKYIRAELARYDNLTGREKKENSHIPMNMYTIGVSAAVDTRLVVDDAPDEPNSKTNAVVKETLRSLKDSASYKGTIAIFADHYQNVRSGFNLYEDIRKKLIAEGVPADQIVVIKSGMTVKKKLDIFEKVNAGEIRVIMGSTSTLGTGVNIQERLHTLVHMDAPNRPMDYIQRNGRILRQGNLHKDMGIPVRVLRFGVEDSADVTAYQRLKTKGAISDAIMDGSKLLNNSMDNRVIEEDEDQYGDMLAQLSGSEYAILKNQAEREVRSLTAKQKGHDIDQIYVHNQLPKVEGFIRGAEHRIALETKNLEIIGKHFPDGSIKKITIGKLTFAAPEGGELKVASDKELNDFFKAQNAKMNEAAEAIREGADNYTSKLTVDVDGLQFEVTTTVRREVDSNGQGTLSFEPERNVTYSCEALGIKDESVKGNRLKNVIQKIAEEIATGNASRELLNRGQQQLTHYREEYRLLQERNGREFPYKAQLAEAKERLAKYEEAMKKELEEKEAKYAEMDKSVEAASDITLADEDSAATASDNTKFRDGETMTPGERLRAIRALEPVAVERNNLSRAELREVYNNLPSVEKDGREIEFYRSAFKKVYRDGGMFGQVVPVLDEVLEKAVLAYSEQDSLGGVARPDGTIHKEHTNVAVFDNYVGKVSIDGVDYYARITVQNGFDGNSGMHSCFVNNVDLYEKTAEFDSSPGYPRATEVNGNKSANGLSLPITTRAIGNADGIVDAKLQQFFERASSEVLELDKADRVRELSEKLNTPVRIVTEQSEIDNLPSTRHRRAKGYFDPATGEVVIVIPNNRDVADVDNTVVHEVVGHKGLRALIGEERFDEFLGEVYDHASESIRKVIDKKTDDMVNAEADRLRVRKAQTRERAGEDVNSHYYADMAEARVEAEAKREEFRKEATEEYMSDLGGRIGSEGFEKMSRDELTLWGKIKAKVQLFLDKFLRGLKIARSIRLTDKDLAYILFKSWKNMREKQGKGGVFAEAEDAVMRRRTGYGEPELRPMTRAEKAAARAESTADRIEELFDKAVSGDLTGKPIEVGRLTVEGKAYLERLSGIKLKEEVSFVLNPSDMVHIYRRHYGSNEKDGRNIPLTSEDIRQMAEIIAAPDRVVFGQEKGGNERNMFFFLKDAGDGSYNLMEIYSDKKGNLTAKSFFKSKEGVSQRAMLLNESSTLTSVTDGATLSDVAKLPKFFEYPTSEREEKLRFRDGDLGLEETITKMKAEAMQANADNLQAKREAMRAIGGNLNHLRQAMARQREYDITTVKCVTDLARVLMDAGLLDDLSKYETKRILGAINNVVGKQDVSQYVQKVMDIMVDNQLRMGANTLGRLLSIRGSRVDSRGIEVQGELDPEGQRIAQVVRKSVSLPKDDIDDRIAEALNRMGSTDQAIADEATLEYAGLQIARRYVEEITESKAEEKALRDSIKQAKEDKDAGQMTESAYRQYVSATEDAIRQNKIERAEAFHSLVEQVGGVLSESVARAKAWREAEKQRVEEIHHNANSDMEGRPTDEHHKEDRVQKLANNSGVRFLLAPLATFDQMLRMFGKKNARGEGYLWNRYMRGWVSATEKEYTGYRDALRVLDAKVSGIFGKGMKWGDLFSIDRKLPKASVRFFDGGEMKDHELTQGNLLYIYMADKMSDGRMKLRRMGITEEDIEAIKNFLDPRFIQLADWMQEEFLVDKRNEYNEVHKRMFGASMAAIENYFPLKILANARLEDVDVAEPEAGSQLPSTSTGSIIKRRRNNLALDVTGANAFSVILDHLQQMERWAAFAEFNRDLNTLLSYKRFRNQVMNMSSVYGGGKTLWNNFRNVCSMAAGAYRPPIAALDKSAVNIAKGVTAAKVSFRVFTALKQFLSMPAYISDSNPVYLAANIANPIGAWRWSMKNLPLFEKRWSSRMAGDPRLLKSDMDWKMWRSRVVEIASRVGMSPNAFVDALTVAIGSHSMYQTKLAKYKRQGYATDVAEARAKQDATILFNQTQQSSEGAFLSTMQVDRSWLSVLFTVFRNSSMSYTRQLYDSIRNIGRRFTPGYKILSEEFMAKQMRRDGIDPDKADRNAKEEYRRGFIRDIVRVGVFGYILQLAWNLGAYLPYLILGEDEEEKDSMWQDVWNHTMFGSIEGLTGGDVMSAAGNMLVSGEGNPQYLTKDMPLASDVLSILKKMDKDEVSAMNDVINLLVQSTVGVNPQSLTDAVVAVMDYCGDDAETSRECALLIARVLNCPQSQLDKIYFDELDATGEEASRMTPAQIAERYAEYKMMREAPLTGWMRTEEERDSISARRQKKVLDVAKARLDSRVNSEEMRQLLNEYEEVAHRQTEISRLREDDPDAFFRERQKLVESTDMARHQRVGLYRRDIKQLTKRYLRAQDPAERDSVVGLIFSTRDRLLEDLDNMQQ